MLCRDGKHAVSLRINTLRTYTEQQTVQVLTHVVIYTLQTSHKGTTQYKYIFGIYLLKHRQIGNNEHIRVTWDPEHVRGKVRFE